MKIGDFTMKTITIMPIIVRANLWYYINCILIH